MRMIGFKIGYLLFLLLFTNGITGCADAREPNAMTDSSPQSVAQNNGSTFTGTIVYKTMEGGFFALITEQNQHFTLHHLPAEFRLDGLIVSIKGKINKDIVSFTQFGDILEVNEVIVIDDSKAKSPAQSKPRQLKSL